MLDKNLFNPINEIKEKFPEAILNGSLLGDGSLDPCEINNSFTLVQTATPETWYNGKEHITYLLYVFAKIPPLYFKTKPLYLRKDPSGYWDFRLTTRVIPFFDSYFKAFYPLGTTKSSGAKQIPTLSYLKSIIKDYDTIAHLIFQDGNVLIYEIQIAPCPLSYKGTARVALALTECLGIPCYVRISNNNNISGGLIHTIIIVRAGMDGIINNTKDLLELMPYKNLTPTEKYYPGTYDANLIKTQDWYAATVNLPWVETHQM